MIRKCLSMLLVCVLLGQSSAVFAQDSSVAQSRNRAQQAAKKYLNAQELGLVVGGLVAVPTIVYLAQKSYYSRMKNENISLKQENATLRKEPLRQMLAEKDKQINFLNNKVKGLTKQQAINAQRLAEGKNKQQMLQQSLDNALQEQASLRSEVQVLESLFKDNINVERYAALVGKPVEELNAVLPKMLQEDFTTIRGTRITANHLRIIQKDLVDALSMPYAESAGSYLQFLSRGPHMHASFLRNLAKQLGAKKNVMIFALLITTGAVLQSSNVDKQIMRLQQNPSLLLSMTDKQAKQLDKSPLAREVCQLIADAYEDAAALPAEEAAAIAREMSTIPQVSLHQLAR